MLHILKLHFLLKYNGLAIVQKTTKKQNWLRVVTVVFRIYAITSNFLRFLRFFQNPKTRDPKSRDFLRFLSCFVRFLELQCNVCLNVMLNWVWKLRCMDLICTLLCVLCIPLPVFLSVFSFLLLFLVYLLCWVLPVLSVCFFMCFASYQQTLTSFLWVTTDQLALMSLWLCWQPLVQHF